MKLLLTSGGITNESMTRALQDLLGTPFAESNLAFIPTAANVEVGDKEWLIKDLVKCKELGFQEVDIVDISAMPRDVWEPRLRNADVLLLGGGNTFHLMYWIKKSGLEKLLPKLLEKRVYVGISAGSIVATPSVGLSFSERLYSEEIPEYATDEGLGFVDFEVRPHLNSPHFPKVREETLTELAKRTTVSAYAMDDETAIKIVDGKMEVISEGVWKRFN